MSELVDREKPKQDEIKTCKYCSKPIKKYNDFLNENKDEISKDHTGPRCLPCEIRYSSLPYPLYRIEGFLFKIYKKYGKYLWGEDFYYKRTCKICGIINSTYYGRRHCMRCGAPLWRWRNPIDFEIKDVLEDMIIDQKNAIRYIADYCTNEKDINRWKKPLLKEDLDKWQKIFEKRISDFDERDRKILDKLDVEVDEKHLKELELSLNICHEHLYQWRMYHLIQHLKELRDSNGLECKIEDLLSQARERIHEDFVGYLRKKEQKTNCRDCNKIINPPYVYCDDCIKKQAEKYQAQQKIKKDILNK
ncbi:MAG: hypothetical protein V1875_00945 [Candidatus Altiarchaeota archaeon]